MVNRRNYIFTHHLRERFIQRTNKKFEHLQHCHESNCEVCRNLLYEIRETIEGDRRPLDREIAQCLDDAIEVRSYLNNSGFMQWYYDKYGYKRFEFMAYKNDLLFVVVVDDGRKVVVTCVSAKTHIAGRQVQRPKFGRKKKEKENAGI